VPPPPRERWAEAEQRAYIYIVQLTIRKDGMSEAEAERL